MKIAVVYARFSSDRQNEQSIDGQLYECQKFAERNDIIIVHNYIDRAMTGTNDNRVEFQQMLKDSDKQAWDYVLVYKLDRFSRNKYEMAIHRKRLSDNGIKIISAMENIPDSPEGILLESLLEGMNQYYSEELSQKTKRGMHQTRLKGHFIGGVPNYGYSVVDVIDDTTGKKVAAKVIINETEAPIVLDIYTQYANGKIVPEILKSLNERGLKIRGREFTAASIYHILRQEKYTGIYKLNGYAYDKIYPRIVPQDIYDIVVKRLDANKHGHHAPPDKSYLLRGLISCGHCGKKVVAYTGTSKSKVIWRYYKCYQTRVNCECKSVNKDLLESLVLDALRKLLQNDETILTLANKIYETYCKRENNNSTLKLLEKEYAQVCKSLKNLIKAIEAGMFFDSTRQRLQELESSKKALANKIALAKDNSKPLPTIQTILTYIRKALKHNEQNLINLLVQKIILYNDKVQILLKYTNTPTDDDTNKRRRKNNKKNSIGINPDRSSLFLSYNYHKFTLANGRQSSKYTNLANNPFVRTVEIYI